MVGMLNGLSVPAKEGVERKRGMGCWGGRRMEYAGSCTVGLVEEIWMSGEKSREVSGWEEVLPLLRKGVWIDAGAYRRIGTDDVVVGDGLREMIARSGVDIIAFVSMINLIFS